jgi:hypothetical protein
MTKKTRRTLYPLLGIVVALSGIQCASAARVWNFTNQTIEVFGSSKGPDIRAVVKPGQQSDSISSNIDKVIILHPHALTLTNATVCVIDSKDPLSGANYLVVLQHGTMVTCTLCNGSRKAIYTARGGLKTGQGYEYSSPGRPTEFTCE